jgi:hypothetical protein
MFSLNCKHVQHVKIYIPCNFEEIPLPILTDYENKKKGEMKFKKNLLL